MCTFRRRAGHPGAASAVMLVLLTLITGRMASGAYIAGVTIPHVGHVQPMAALLEELQLRGHSTSVATSNIVELFKFNDSLSAITRRDEALYQHHLNAFQQKLPDLLVVDADAGFGVRLATHFNLPYVINSVGTLASLDVMDSLVPGPVSALAWNMNLSTFDILRALFRRFTYKQRAHQLPTAFHPGTVHRRLDAGPLGVLVNTNFGLEAPRPLPEHIVLTGPLLPHAFRLELSESATSASADTATPVDDMSDSQHPSKSSHASQSLGNSPYTPSDVLSKLALPPHLLADLEFTMPTLLIDLGQSTPVTEATARAMLSDPRASAYQIIWLLHTKKGKDAVESVARASRCLVRVWVGNSPLQAFTLPQVSAALLASDPYLVHAALVAGVPVVAMPSTAMQAEVAEQVTAFGAGLTVPLAELTPTALWNAVQAIHDNKLYRSLALRGGQLLLGGSGVSAGVGRAADVIHSIVGHRDVPRAHNSLEHWHAVLTGKHRFFPPESIVTVGGVDGGSSSSNSPGVLSSLLLPFTLHKFPEVDLYVWLLLLSSPFAVCFWVIRCCVKCWCCGRKQQQPPHASSAPAAGTSGGTTSRRHTGDVNSTAARTSGTVQQ